MPKHLLPALARGATATGARWQARHPYGNAFDAYFRATGTGKYFAGAEKNDVA